jgi:outer membrane protein assembly factor BamB
MLARDGVLYADASPDILAIDVATGRLLWRYTSRALAVTFGVGDGLVIAGMHQGEVHGINLATGERAWRYRTNESVRGTPVIDETEGIAYFGTLDGFIHAISLRGEEVEGDRGWWPW